MKDNIVEALEKYCLLNNIDLNKLCEEASKSLPEYFPINNKKLTREQAEKLAEEEMKIKFPKEIIKGC
jgi:hypothetical protein